MIVQGTPEWFAARCGRVTASRIADLTAKIKSGDWGASRKNYMAQLLCERLTGVVAPSYVSPEMQRGTDLEPEARAAYEFHANVTVTECGFDIHPRIPMAGASLDGEVGKDGITEFKVPNTATHLDTLLGGSLDGGYFKQVQWQLACRPERKWCDWCSYDPRLPEAMRLFVKRVPRDNAVIEGLEHDVENFLRELAQKESELRRLYKLAA